MFICKLKIKINNQYFNAVVANPGVYIPFPGVTRCTFPINGRHGGPGIL